MPQQPNPEMAILARLSRGFTQADVATTAGISQSKVSKFEAGLTQVSSDDLARIAGALNYPESFFTQYEPLYPVGNVSTFFRKRKTLPAKELEHLLARLTVKRLAIRKLIQGVELETANAFPVVNPEWLENGIESAAAMMRLMWRVPNGPISNVIATLESAGAIVLRMPFESRQIDAVGDFSPSLPPIFFLNESFPTDRQRFSLCHELAHRLLHSLPHDTIEHEADAFAAAFLLPKEELIVDFAGRVTVDRLVRLKMKWGVSIQALARRARDLNAISESRYKGICIEISSMGWRLKEPVELVPEQPQTLRRIVDYYRSERGFSFEDVCKMVHSAAGDLEQIYGNEKPKLRIVA